MNDPASRPPPTTAPDPSELAALLAQLGAVVLTQETLATTVELVTTLAAEAIPGAAGAGVTLADSRGKRSVASSDDFVTRVDALQYQFDSGPCLTSWRERVAVRVEDVTRDGRWPEWAAAASATGVRSVLSLPLLAGEACIGAIKVYSTQPGVFDARDERLLTLFARQAAILLVNTQTLVDARRSKQQLTEALQEREVVGQAKGILLARGADDEPAAFALLVAASERTNTKVHLIARRLVESVVARNADGDHRR